MTEIHDWILGDKSSTHFVFKVNYDTHKSVIGMLRRSSVPRLSGLLDIQIIQIESSIHRHGLAYGFIRDLELFCNDVGLGTELENCLTDGSYRLGQRLMRRDSWTRQDRCYYSPDLQKTGKINND